MTRDPAIPTAVANLLARYTECIDAGDFDGVGSLFAHGDMVDEHGNVLVVGAAAVADFYRNTVQLHDGSPRTKHLVLNLLLEDPAPAGGAVDTAVDGDGDGDGQRAVVRSSYLVLQGVGGHPLQPIITGRYRDTFVRHPDHGWRWERRQFFVDLMGDLSRHLRFEL